jgi:hypothetical protein
MNIHKKLQKVLDYDPTTGVMTWAIKRGNLYPGKIAGCAYRKERKSGPYWLIELGGKRRKRANLAWFHYYGVWPTKALDHINGNSLDDRISNLREATPKENSWNRPKQRNNVSGYKGVHLNEGKWRAKIGNTVLGRFTTPEEASAAYQAAALQRYGKFHRIP